MATPTEGRMALVRSQGHYDLTEYSEGQTVEIIREALTGQDADRIRGQMKHILMISGDGQHKFVEGFTELSIELLHAGNYSDSLLFIGVLREHQLTSGNLWVLQDVAKVLSEDEDLGSPVSTDMADPAFLHRLETEFPTEWQRYQEAFAPKED